jgi:hypothetical protein
MRYPAMLLLAGAVLAAGCGGDNAKLPDPLTIQLSPRNGSGVSGTAQLTDKGLSGTTVVVELSVPKRFRGAAQPASINGVSCAALGRLRQLEARERTVAQLLREVRDGRSETTAAQSLVALTSGRYSLNVYDDTYPFLPVACADIRR